MKKVKALLALILVLSLFCMLFAACSNGESGTSGTPAGDSGTADKDTGSSSAGGNDADKPDDAGDAAEEPTEIIFYMYDMRSTGGDYGQPINEAVNEMMEEAINVTLEIHWVNSGDWSSKVNLALSGGERIDVINLNPTPGSRVNNLYPQGLLMDIGELLEEYAPGALEVTKDYIGTYTYGGKVYGLPTIRNYCKNGYILMNKQILEELDMLDYAQNIRSWSEFDTILEAVYDNYTAKGTGMYPIGLSSTTSTDYTNSGDSFDTYVPFDNLGDSLGVLFNDADGNISLYQASEGYKFACEKGVEWNSKGWIWPDSEYTTEFVDDVQKQKVIFSNICGSEYGVQTTKSNAYGYEVIAVNTCIGMVKTAQPQFTGVAIPTTAEEPEAAAKFINELYTNADLMNLLIWGREGEEYTVQDGQVVSAEGTHYLSVDFILGNNTLLTPLMGNGADFYDKVKEINETADKSPFLGFAFDTGELDLYMSQITAVTDQYAKNMIYGGYTPEKLDEYISKLNDAGVQEYLDEAQRQLDAFRAK